jgi:primosomal protein N'
MSGWCKWEIECTECDWSAELYGDNIPPYCPHCNAQIKSNRDKDE